MNNVRIESYPELDDNNPHVQKILNVIGEVFLQNPHLSEECFASTESMVGDFHTWGSSREDDDAGCHLIGEKLGIQVKLNSYIWELAAQLELRNKDGIG